MPNFDSVFIKQYISIRHGTYKQMTSPVHKFRTPAASLVAQKLFILNLTPSICRTTSIPIIYLRKEPGKTWNARQGPTNTSGNFCGYEGSIRGSYWQRAGKTINQEAATKTEDAKSFLGCVSKLNLIYRRRASSRVRRN